MNTYICTCATWICVTCVFIEYVHVAYLYIHIGDHSPQDVAVDPGNHLGETRPQHFTDLGHGFPPGQLSLATTLSCRPNCVNKQGTSSNGGICVQNVRETYFNIWIQLNKYMLQVKFLQMSIPTTLWFAVVSARDQTWGCESLIFDSKKVQRSSVERQISSAPSNSLIEWSQITSII